MGHDQIRAGLENAGLSTYQADAYLTLLEHGVLPAVESGTVTVGDGGDEAADDAVSGDSGTDGGDGDSGGLPTTLIAGGLAAAVVLGGAAVFVMRD